MTRDQLLAIMPLAVGRVDLFLPHLNAAMAEFEINTPARVAAFLANVAHESGELSDVEENLNYSASGLAKTWPHRYAELDGDGDPIKPIRPNALAWRLHRDPVRIANNVYADRMGNGPEYLGNGWKHRGAGIGQLTGKDNQYAAALHFNVDPEQIGDWLRSPEGACRSFAWFWKENGCNELADVGDFDGCCDKVNRGRKTQRHGDSNGFADRLAFYNRAIEVLA